MGVGGAGAAMFVILHRDVACLGGFGLATAEVQPSSSMIAGSRAVCPG